MSSGLHFTWAIEDFSCEVCAQKRLAIVHRPAACYVTRRARTRIFLPSLSLQMTSIMAGARQQSRHTSKPHDARAALPRGTKETKSYFTLRAMKEPEYRLGAYIGVFF